MKLKLKIKTDKKTNKNRIYAWIQKKKEFYNEIQDILKFFNDKISISRLSKILPYYIITSRNPAIILSLFTSIQEIIPEIYFNQEDSIEI